MRVRKERIMSNPSNSGGIGFFGILTILFIALKLTGTITWSWWWVLSPLWIPAGIMIIISIIISAIALVVAARK
jgi:hypothetical protein